MDGRTITHLRRDHQPTFRLGRDGSRRRRAGGTVGAGDSFNAGFLYATLQGWPLAERLRLANAWKGEGRVGVRYSGQQWLLEMVARQHAGEACGIYAVCSAHEAVLAASFARALADGSPLLVESTCNQVNQYGGYTAQTPADFAQALRAMAERFAFPRERLILGGGPSGAGPLAARAGRSGDGQSQGAAARLRGRGLRKNPPGRKHEAGGRRSGAARCPPGWPRNGRRSWPWRCGASLRQSSTGDWGPLQGGGSHTLAPRLAYEGLKAASISVH